MTTTKTMLAAMAAGCLATACANVQGTEVKPAPPVKVQAATPAAPADGVRYSAAIEPFEPVSPRPRVTSTMGCVAPVSTAGSAQRSRAI